MNPEAMKPYGTALLDYHKGNTLARITVIRDDGLVTPLPASTFFRHAQAVELERTALEMTYGHVLDVGAGTGIHSLFLQEKGLRVCAIDILPEAIRIMRERGVMDARQADVMSLSRDVFDTIIMLGHGIGVVGNLSGLDRFLRHVSALLNTGGQVLLTSMDVRATSDPQNLLYQKKTIESGRYFGEVVMQFKFRNARGPMFNWLHVDAATLSEHAERCGWRCEVIRRQDDGNYLAKLSFGTV